MESSLNRRTLALVLGSAFLLVASGCGMGRKVVSNVAVENQIVGSDLYVSLDATLSSGALYLPNVKLPLYHPKNPSQQLGEIETNGLKISVRVNASQALNLRDLSDRVSLPGGSDLPLVLPQGLKPIGIPVFNSNSMVYLAVSGQQVMIGIAVAIAKEDRLNLPLNIFLPFNISPEVAGTAGFFLGQKQGVAVFALREGAVAGSGSALASTSSNPSAASDAGLRSFAVSSAKRISVREEPLSSAKVRRLENTWNHLNRVRID